MLPSSSKSKRTKSKPLRPCVHSYPHATHVAAAPSLTEVEPEQSAMDVPKRRDDAIAEREVRFDTTVVIDVEPELKNLEAKRALAIVPLENFDVNVKEENLEAKRALAIVPLEDFDVNVKQEKREPEDGLGRMRMENSAAVNEVGPVSGFARDIEVGAARVHQLGGTLAKLINDECLYVLSERFQSLEHLCIFLDVHFQVLIAELEASAGVDVGRIEWARMVERIREMLRWCEKEIEQSRANAAATAEKFQGLEREIGLLKEEDRRKNERLEVLQGELSQMKASKEESDRTAAQRLDQLSREQNNVATLRDKLAELKRKEDESRLLRAQMEKLRHMLTNQFDAVRAQNEWRLNKLKMAHQCEMRALESHFGGAGRE